MIKKQTLFYVPIEPYEDRYSEQWIRWFKQEFERRNINYHIIFGESLSTSVLSGSVFNPVSIAHYRATQLAKIHRQVAEGVIKDGDVLFFDDGQFPGVEQITQYLPQIRYKNLKLYSFMHAGTWDPYDYVHRFGLTPWIRYEEQAWMVIFEKVFVAVPFHKSLIEQTLPDAGNKIVITGIPFNTTEIYNSTNIVPFSERKWDAVFPIRCDSEKGVITLLQLTRRLTKAINRPFQYIIPQTVNANKQTYYNILANAKLVISASLQETFGIGVAEAVTLGCIPVLPNRLSYTDIYPKDYLYNTEEEAVSLAVNFLTNLDDNKWKLHHKSLLDIIRQFDFSIERIITQMGF